MIRFKEFLSEIFGGSNVYKWTREAENEYEFVTDKKEVFIVNIEYSNRARTYLIQFGISDYDDISLSLTKSNNLSGALKVYNTVIDIIKKEIKPHLKSGDIIEFSPANIRTTNVYDKFSKMIAKEIGGTAQKEKDYHGDVVFKVYKS